MARARRYGDDLTVAEWHRHRLPELYRRVGHRLDMADRDWTEFCHFCKRPLAIWEEVIDRGQDLDDKGTAVTERLASMAHIPAILVAPRIPRPTEVQARINALHAEIRSLEMAWPITGFRLRRLCPDPDRRYHRLAPDEFAAEIHLLHRDHHQRCRLAERQHPVVRTAQLQAAQARSRIWTPRQQRLSVDVA